MSPYIFHVVHTYLFLSFSITSTSDDLDKRNESLLRSLQDAEGELYLLKSDNYHTDLFAHKRSKNFLAQALALKSLNEALEKEVDRLKVNYNKLDDECADLWRERLLQKREPLSHHRKPLPPSTPVNFGWDMRGYLDSIDHVVEREPYGGFISIKEKIMPKEEKLEQRVKRVLLAKDVVMEKVTVDVIGIL